MYFGIKRLKFWKSAYWSSISTYINVKQQPHFWVYDVSTVVNGTLSASFGSGLQPLLLSSDLRFHFGDHFRQQFFAFLLAVSIDIARTLFAIRPDRGVSTLPEFLVDLGDASCTCLAPLALVGLEGAGGRFSGCQFSACLRFGLTDALVNLHRRRPAHLIGDMGVDVQCGAAGDVPDDSGEGLNIHAMFQGNGRKCVSEVMESDFFAPGSLQNGL